ncbi:tomoregulin-2-like [Haliotis cracherodii]|uniref:tomoregulin-2-like n=1 Tax=Haliotis cracherodii TaxID=6455 RepID=UPI0039EBB13F
MRTSTVCLLLSALIVLTDQKQHPNNHPEGHHGDHQQTTHVTESVVDQINEVILKYNPTMCQHIHGLHCDTLPADSKVCGSNSETYESHCKFAQARCKHHDVDFVKYGACDPITPAPHTTLPSPSTEDQGLLVTSQTLPPSIQVTTTTPSVTTTTWNTITWGHDPSLDLIKEVFCRNIDAISCGNGIDSDICGSDGRVYTNMCMFSKVACFKPGLEVVNCGGHGLPVITTTQSPVPLLG